MTTDLADRTLDTQAADSGHSPLTARQAANLLGVNERTIRRAIAQNRLPAVKHSGVWHIQHDDLMAFGHPRPTPMLVPRVQAMPPFHVPQPRSLLIGREAELRAATTLLQQPDVPLLTMLGPSGSGKTRLALAVAGSLRNAFADGIWFVDLSAIREPSQVLAAISSTLDLWEVAGISALDRLREYLELREVLLILDNLEQVIEASPELAQLLAMCSRLTILATSRTPLKLSTEHQFPVPPLAVPGPEHDRAITREEQFPSIQLFCDKARAVNPQFQLTPTDAPTVGAICAHLDGLPLAIELAAARSNLLAPAALLALLDTRLPILTGGPTDMPPRLRSMRDAIAWSYDLLDAADQQLFRRLAIFAGGFTLETAESVIGQPGSLFESIATLVSNSLVIPIPGSSSSPRFTLLETIREFGLEQLERHGEMALVCQAHAAWWQDFGAKSTDWWFTAGQERWADEIADNHDNLRAALAWLRDSGDRQALVEMVSSVWTFWFVRNHWAEGIFWLRQALAWSEGDRTLRRIRVLMGAGCLVQLGGDEPAATILHDEAWDIVHELGNVSPVNQPWVGSAMCALMRGRLDEVAQWYEAALAAMRAAGDGVSGVPECISVILGNQAYIAFDEGNIDRADELATEALTIQHRIGYTWGASSTTLLRARIARLRGDGPEATHLYHAGLEFFRTTMDVRATVTCIDTFTLELERDAGRPRQVALLLGVSERLHEIVGSPPHPEVAAELDRMTRETRAILGEASFTDAWTSGRTLSLDEVIDVALQTEVIPSETSVQAWAAGWGVTHRELDVLRLVSERLSDREIADLLSISLRTVNTHVSHIIAKLGVDSRQAAGTVFRERICPQP